MRLTDQETELLQRKLSGLINDYLSVIEDPLYESHRDRLLKKTRRAISMTLEAYAKVNGVGVREEHRQEMLKILLAEYPGHPFPTHLHPTRR